MIHPKSKYTNTFDVENLHKKGNGVLEIIKLHYSILIKIYIQNRESRRICNKCLELSVNVEIS